jgi:hypothetical protein
MPRLLLPSSRTLREFVFQLATIIAGILVALWVDGIVEARRERTLVRDAHAALAREITDNLKSLSGTLPWLDEHERSLGVGIRFANEMLKTGKTGINTLNFPLNMGSLSRASWQSAERTGALGSMDFADVKAYAEIYDLQELVVDGQRQLLARITDVTGRLFAGEDGDPAKMKPQELEAFRTRVLDAIGGVKIHKMLASQLVKAYKQAPKR